MKKLILFGDSNTYGYDPRDFFGGRYPENVRWATMVRHALKNEYDVIEEGQNGRALPSTTSSFFRNMIEDLNTDDVLAMMLGTNDILLVNYPNAEAPVRQLDSILAYVKEHCKGKFILIAPPYISDIYPDLKSYHDCCVEMNIRFMELAKKYDIDAIDAAVWNIPMGSDGVHFSIEGHKIFGEKILLSLNSIL